MADELTAVFLRPATEREPHVTSIAVDLSLRPTAPQPARPWACRISAALIQPGPDGLATAVVDVERLTELGRAVLDRLGGNAVCAAVTTAAARRTWLLYVAPPADATDPAADPAADVAATVRSAVRMSFAEQADYVPTVAVEHDPEWAGYRSLCPTPAERADLDRRRAQAAAAAAARTATDAGVAALRAAGPHPAGWTATVHYRLTFPTPAARASFLARAVACQFRTVATDAASAEVARESAVEAAAIGDVERWLLAEARRVNGRYDGWTVPAADPARRAA